MDAYEELSSLSWTPRALKEFITQGSQLKLALLAIELMNSVKAEEGSVAKGGESWQEIALPVP